MTQQLKGKFRDPKSKKIYTVLGEWEEIENGEGFMSLNGIIDNNGRYLNTDDEGKCDEKLVDLAFEILNGMVD